MQAPRQLKAAAVAGAGAREQRVGDHVLEALEEQRVESSTVKALINEGPPGGMLSRFTLWFDEKAAATDVAADVAMLELGW